ARRLLLSPGAALFGHPRLELCHRVDRPLVPAVRAFLPIEIGAKGLQELLTTIAGATRDNRVPTRGVGNRGELVPLCDEPDRDDDLAEPDLEGDRVLRRCQSVDRLVRPVEQSVEILERE